MLKNNHTFLIKQWARDLGFDHCGIAKAVVLDEDARRLETWLNKGMNGSMAYMENYFDIRIDPSRLVPGARSVITLLLNYFPGQGAGPEEKNTPENGAADWLKPTDRQGIADQPIATDRPRVAKYAYGKDYHEVIRDKLKNLLELIRGQIGEVNGRGFVDSAPVLERSWAVRSGLGWVGKNGNLLNKKAGSFFLLLR